MVFALFGYVYWSTAFLCARSLRSRHRQPIAPCSWRPMTAAAAMGSIAAIKKQRRPISAGRRHLSAGRSVVRTPRRQSRAAGRRAFRRGGTGPISTQPNLGSAAAASTFDRGRPSRRSPMGRICWSGKDVNDLDQFARRFISRWRSSLSLIFVLAVVASRLRHPAHGRADRSHQRDQPRHHAKRTG